MKPYTVVGHVHYGALEVLAVFHGHIDALGDLPYAYLGHVYAPDDNAALDAALDDFAQGMGKS